MPCVTVETPAPVVDCSGVPVPNAAVVPYSNATGRASPKSSTCAARAAPVAVGVALSLRMSGSSRLARICWTSLLSCSSQATYGTPPTLATLGLLASRSAATFSVPPTEVHVVPSKRSAWTRYMLLSYSSQATRARPPMSAMLGLEGKVPGAVSIGPPTMVQVLPSSRLTYTWRAGPVPSGHATYGTLPMPAIRGPSALFAAVTESEPPTGVQAEPSSRATRTCSLVPLSSCQVTYGTPPMLAMLGLRPFSIVETLSAAPTATHEPPSSRLTRIRSWVPSYSYQATYGTPPTSAMLACWASRAVLTFSASPTAVQLPLSRRLTRIWARVPSLSSQATYGTPPTLVMLG